MIVKIGNASLSLLNEQSGRLALWEIGEFGPCEFEHWSSKTNDLKIYTCCFLARCLALLGQGKDWLAQSG